MTTVINDINFDDVIGLSLDAAKAVVSDSWDEIKDIVKIIGEGLTSDVVFIAKKKINGEFNEQDAKIFLEDQKMLARIRLRSIGIITLQLAERIWNAVAEVFRSAINTALGWSIL